MLAGKPARLTAVLIPVLLVGAPALAERFTLEDALIYMTELDHLPAIQPGVRCLQFSSYDRASRIDEATGKYIDWDANGDAGNFIREDENTHEGVMAEMKGPGCIFRLWSANPKGVIRFYLDGDDKPTYEFDFRALCAGEIEPFIEPLVWKRPPKNETNTASNCYFPIPFAKSCRVTGLDKNDAGKPIPPRQYYIIDYRSFPADWQVETFKLPLTDAQKKAVEQTARKWRECGSPLAIPGVRSVRDKVIVEPGGTVKLPEVTGPAVIRQFAAKLQSSEAWATRKLLVRAYWDGESKPAIDCPIGDFFGESHDEATYRSYPMGITPELNYCRFPMPFRKSARFEIVNEGRQPATVQYQIDSQEQQIPQNWGLFHAKWRTEIASTSFDYPLLKAEGTGKLVGIAWFPHNHHGGWWGEGDEKVWVDGEKFPSWYGTGSEDYLGDAWGTRMFHNPSHGFPQHKEQGWNDGDLVGCYRWHLGDNIPFYKSFAMTIENYAGLPDVKTRNDYSSVAYWYQLPGGSDFFAPTPVADRIPAAFVMRDAVEAEAILPPKPEAGIVVVDDAALPQPLSRGHGLKLSGKPGANFPLPVSIRDDGRYVVELGTAREVKGCGFEIIQDDKPVGKYVTLTKENCGEALSIRLTEPAQGERCELILDYVRVEPYHNLIPDWIVIGPFPNDEQHGGLEKVYPPESELDRTKTYEGRGGKKIRWEAVSEKTGRINLTPLGGRKPQLFVAYAACVVTAPEDLKDTLLIGSDDGCKVWLNGKLIHTNPAQRPLVPDSDRVEVQLKKGENTLLVKVEQGEGDAGLAARFADPRDRLKYSLPK